MRQPEIRETPGGLREQPPTAAHATRAAGRMSGLWRRPVVRIVGFSAAVGFFLSFVSAFDTGEIPFLRRTALFLAFSVFGGFISAGAVRWAGWLSWSRGAPWRRFAFVGAVMTLVMGTAVWIVVGVADPDSFRLVLLPQYLAVSLVMSTILTGVAYAVFRPTTVTHAGPAGSAPPRFLARLPAALKGAELWAVQAEDHYLRIHSSRGSDLILMRLADAVAELDGIEGAQTHRSWWVARAAVRDVRRGEGRATLVLANGLEAPVSRSHARTLREAGWF